MTIRVRLSEPLRARLPASPEACVAVLETLVPARLLAESRTTRTAVVELPGRGRIVRKQWRWPTASDRARGAFRTTVAARSPAEREARALERLSSLPSGAFGPRPLGVIEERRAGVLTACTLLTEEIADATDLAHWLLETDDPALRRRVLEDLGRRLGEMHAAGLVDREFHPRNVLVVPASERTYKVDTPKQRIRRAPLRPAAAALDLAALDVGLTRLATTRERLRALRAYAQTAGGTEARDALCARIERTRSSFDAREARRLPAAR